MINSGLILAIALALVHGFGTRLPIFSIVPKFRWLSFASGVSLGCVLHAIFKCCLETGFSINTADRQCNIL